MASNTQKLFTIKIKKNSKNKRIKFVNSSIERIDELKFKNYFDLVFLTWTLGSSARPDKLIDKVYKILKLNGLVVISESSRILVRPKVSIFWYFNNFNTFKNYPWRFSSNSIKNLLTSLLISKFQKLTILKITITLLWLVKK